MKFLSLFSGIGGFDLGLERAGMECVGQVEIDPYCLSQLERHWPHVRRWTDVRSVSFRDLDRAGLDQGEFGLNGGATVSEPMAVRAEQDAVLDGERPTVALEDDVVRVTGGLSPAAAQAVRAVQARQRLSPRGLGGVGGALGDEVRTPFVPSGAADTAPVVVVQEPHGTPSMLGLGDDLAAASASAFVDSHQVDFTTFADVICAGTPCQDLSVAGKRAGLAGERSGLFMEFVRVIREMREASGGRYPTYALWENVPGAFSSHGGRDFASVLAALADAGALDIAWRVLDSRWFGVPQRRRRIFLVADFAGERASEVFAQPEGCAGHPAACGTQGEDVAGEVEDGVSLPLTASGRGTERTGESRGQDTLAGGWRDDLDHSTYVPDIAIRTAQTSANGHGIAEDVAHTIDGANGQAVAHALTADGFDASEDGTGRGTPMTVAGASVRRLTPVECCRLQGFPDDWLDGNDGPRYRALGNAVTVPVIEYLGKRLMEVEMQRRNAN